ncbi:Selenoprotein Pa [Trachymyrmex septentrionalis]|uniref:Selenoprotein Pa n=1 Tax=Trachymyrmex septentrionalis TaxID=34720 RepID=A0A151JVL8_9HYME|nr:Selenoprotein Pa [Trachymyrmex septentrionalis]
MLAAKVAFPVLFLVSLASEARYHSRLSRVFRSSGSDRSSSRRELLGREEQDWYFEQCRFVNAWKEHLGHVSVLAFLDPAWQYSFRQAVMLELLSSRLRKSGFPGIRFFVISPFSDSKDDKSEDDLEIEAWREIGAKYEMENFVSGDFLKNNGTEIIFLQDDPQSRLWERFRASREHAVIIDRCGKLTYHVIVPWSILFFPYVKAAILSTYMDDPCSGCNPAIYQTSNHEDHVVELRKSTEKEVTPAYREVDTKFEIIWTTESLLENVTHLHHESSSEEERETASSILLEKITNDSDRANFSTNSPTESTTNQYDSDATESRFDEDHLNAESTPGQEDSTNSESDGTVSTGTAAIFESQSDMLPPEQKESHPSTNNNSLTTANHEDTTADSTLLLDEPATEVTESDSTFADQEMTSNFANEIRDNTTPEDAEHFGKDAFLPLRIIMYAPHLHKNGKKAKKYTHMILKFGDPNFHEHPDSGTDVASPPSVNAHITSSEEYDWRTTEADEEHVNQTYTFDANESPGLYGEVADYWKSYEDDDIADDRNETFNDTYNNSTTNYNQEHLSDVSDYATNLSKSEESNLITNVTENPNIGSSTDSQNIENSSMIESSRPISENEQIDKKEEIRYKLIEHYNKLLSWIDYRLNK